MKQPRYMVTVLGQVVSKDIDNIKREAREIGDHLNEDSGTFDADKGKPYTLFQVVCTWNGYVLGIWATKS